MSTPEQYRSEINQLTSLAERELATVWAQVDGPASARAVLDDTLPDLIALYGSAAGAVAADWYDEARAEAEITSRFRAIVADLPDVGRAEALAGWAVATGATTASVLSLAQGGLQRIVADVGRQTITRSSVADPGARGWQRSATAGCSFCVMLAGRGAVYSLSTVDFSSHDHCKCIAVPAWDGRPAPVKAYIPSTRTFSDADRARVRQWIADNGL